MQLVPDIEFRVARKGQQQTTTMELNNQQYDEKNFCIYLIFFTPLNRENVDNDMNINEKSDNDETLVDSFQRTNLDDSELSTICTKNFPQQVNSFFIIINVSIRHQNFLRLHIYQFFHRKY